MREPVDLGRRRILAAVQARGTARVRDLADELQVSVVTVHRDVEELTREGRLSGGHGVVRSALAAEEASSRHGRVGCGGRGPGGRGGPGAAPVTSPRRCTAPHRPGGRRGARSPAHLAQASGAERPLVERALADGRTDCWSPPLARPGRGGGRPRVARRARGADGADGAPPVARRRAARWTRVLGPLVRRAAGRGAPGGARSPAHRVRHAATTTPTARSLRAASPR
ncbi:DeoR family transcriptional regulator [Streptomyces thinghirensis]|nr:DeoR family transcriptional regulator [Streptomyces thinghirensis]